VRSTGYGRQDYFNDSAFSWVSSKDGYLGNGSVLIYSGLSEGNHIITLSVNDTEGHVTNESVLIAVMPSDSKEDGSSAISNGVVIV